MKRRILTLLLSGLSGSLLACGEENLCATGGVGALQITITGLPDGTPAVLKLRGPDGSEQTVTSSVSLENLASGEWSAKGEPVAAAGGIVRRAFAAPGPHTACAVPDGMGKLEVAYSEIASSGKLWASAGNAEAPLLAWPAASLAGSGAVAPGVLIDSVPQINSGRGVAFDKHGALWAADASGALKRFPPTLLGASGARVPDIILENPLFRGGIPGPMDLAFDAAGNLWATVVYADKVVRLTPEQLTASGSPTAAVEVSGLASPAGIAFDAAGNLWVADDNRVKKYAASRLGASLASPDLSLEARTDGSGSAYTLSGPTGLAFDTAGNLWVSYFGPNVIARLTPADLTGNGAKQVIPSVQLKFTVSALLSGLAFDEEGHLWTPFRSRELGRIAPSQLATSGTITPAKVIASDSAGTVRSLATYPAPAGTPLYHRLP